MFIIYGTKRILKRYQSNHVKTCEHCHNEIKILYIKATKWIAIFWIPIIPIGTKYYSTCPTCNAGVEISKDEFNDIVSSLKVEN